MDNKIKMMIDIIEGNSVANYSKEQRGEALRQALIDLNGGSTVLDPKKFYRGSDLFSAVQELLPVIINEGFKDSDPIFRFVEYRNIKDGDQQEFFIEGDSILAVAKVAEGTNGIRRQRIDAGQSIVIKTNVYAVKIYAELKHVLSGKVDFYKFIAKVSESFKKFVLGEAYKAISAIGGTTIGLDPTYVVTGVFDEEALVGLIQRVEASTGKVAHVWGTKSALRKVTSAVVSDEAKRDLYTMGYYGNFNGTEMICLKQALAQGASTFLLDDSKLYITAGDDAPVKIVNEGTGIFYEGNPMDNTDFTQEYFYAQPFGIGVICSEKMGIYILQ
jgi:hypothetical protein